MPLQPAPDWAALTQFGVHLVTLDPGAESSTRHWHSAEDECALVLSGTPTLIDNSGPHLVAPGDFVGWRAGVANAHHLRNLSGEPATLLVAGTRVARDICRYPDIGQTQTNTDTDWTLTEDATGAVLKGGPLPPHLLGLPDRWGMTDAPPPPPLVRKGTARRDQATPEQVAHLGDFSADILSDTAGLTQFGAFIETLAPGSRSSDRHWHEAEDEFMYMLDGEATIIDNAGPRHLLHGGSACWPAGVPNGHQVVNRSDQPCRYLIIGTRAPADVVHYSDIDKLYSRRADGTVTRTRRDGSPL